MEWSDVKAFSTWLVYQDGEPILCTHIELFNNEHLYDSRHAPDYNGPSILAILDDIRRATTP